MSRMPCSISDGPRHPDENAPMVPEITEADKIWILNEIDPDWQDHFHCPTLAYEWYWQFEFAEMEKLERECDEDNRAAAQPDELCETLADICRPWLAK